MIGVFICFLVAGILWLAAKEFSEKFIWLATAVPYLKWITIIIGAVFAIILLIKIAKALKKKQ